MAKIVTPSPALFPILEQDVPQKRLGPLARTAAQAPLDSTGCLTEYRPLASRSILSKTTSKRGMPFTHAINPYRGCEFACRYCYARYTHEFMEMRDPEDFERKIYFKQNAGWLLAQELKRLKPGTEIALGTATDPYQPLERKQEVTRSVLEAFARESGFRARHHYQVNAHSPRYRLAQRDQHATQAHGSHHRDHHEHQAGAGA